jgi:hypothetical protein
VRIEIKEPKTPYDKLGHGSREVLNRMGVGRDTYEARPYREVLTSRRDAQRLIDRLGQHAGRNTEIVFDVRHIEIATPSYFHELLKRWPNATIEGANEDVQASWDLCKERM